MAKSIKRDLVVVYYAYRHPLVGVMPKILIFTALAYALSPIDLIPDFIPVIGFLDDILIVPVLIYLSLLFIPEDIMLECRQKAEKEPPVLKNNWIMAVVIIAIWLILIYFITIYFYNFFT
ncbi:MAG TPA: YkvA family protein [Candidatus Wallbacteria bacterium]|nr:YkvA family protein [Candidatus Wallbacteria bacterium]